MAIQEPAKFVGRFDRTWASDRRADTGSFIAYALA